MLPLSFLSASTHPFLQKSGKVIYEIQAGGVLTPHTNININGSGSLIFDTWGENSIEHEDINISISGTLKYHETVQHTIAYTKKKMIVVAEDEEVLVEYRRPKSIGYDLSGFVRDGKLDIDGYSCKLWKRNGVSICLYRGVVLWHNSDVNGLHYLKKAVSIDFNLIKIDKKDTIPKYKKKKSAFFIKMAPKNNLCQLLNQAALDKSSLKPKKRQNFINNISQKMFEKIKISLAIRLNALREVRVCLSEKNSVVYSTKCIENFYSIKKDLEKKEDIYTQLWNNNKKDILLEKIENDIANLQTKSSCIHRSRNITDLSNCFN